MSAVQVEQAGGRSSASRQVWTLRRIAPQQMGGKSSPELSGAGEAERDHQRRPAPRAGSRRA